MEQFKSGSNFYSLMAGWMLAVMVFSVSVLGVSSTSATAAEGQPEYAVKVAYLYNFLKFVHWVVPASDDPGTLTVCILGRDPFEGLIEPLQQRTVRGQNIEIMRLQSVRDILECSLVFIADVDRFPPKKILELIAGKSVLLVGDSPGFAAAGGMLGFVARDGKIKLEINQRSLATTGLEVSAMLLEVATLVGDR